ncbi:MAG: hypothetical protein GKR89_16640 [Candidatus Latescibacteria bacterium]|nr:hypothetical protein [Candidatus Latescibacterota bacterium]
MMRKSLLSKFSALVAVLVLVAGGGRAFGQGEGAGPQFESMYAVPQLHKWYQPRQLPETYWQPWYRDLDNYARYPYARYVERQLEGEKYYDILGGPIGAGWLVYSWTQEQPQARGSDIIKWPGRELRNTSEPTNFDSGRDFVYHEFFKRLVIAADQTGHGSYRLMVGDQIATRFTPLTFYKPRYNGVRLDLAGGAYQGTLLLSRPSDPNALFIRPGQGESPGDGQRTNMTHLLGGHLDIGLGLARLGLTYVNARNAQTQIQLNHGNPLDGALTLLQDQPLRKLWVQVRDDSPADRRDGAVLLAHDIVLVDTSGMEWLGSEIDFLPQVEGGVQQGGALVADGAERILLSYDLEALDPEILRSADLRRVQVLLDLADDYRVETSSNLQTDGRGSRANPVFLTELRAAGNVGDRSNTGLVAVDYGLPVANQIIGFDWDLPAWRGLSLQGEGALNRRLRRYPNPALKRHHQIDKTAAAGYAQLAYRRFSWMAYAEVFAMEDDYSTSYWLTDGDGLINYRAPVSQLYEFVDDDDDLNALPEWQRPHQPAFSEIAWPGYDENGDFVNDHNQNNNLIPDYEEPFLRYGSDRPEFLPGLDMNHNGTIDRFENDEAPDYPYKRDHRGFNVYVRIFATPAIALTAGRQDMRLMAGDGHTRSWYGMALWTWLGAGGRLRVFEQAALVRDNIEDHLVQWIQPLDALGRMVPVDDYLPAQNTWQNGFYADFEQRLGAGVQMRHRFKWDWARQRYGGALLQQREGRRNSGFIGLINRGQWPIAVGLATLEPRFKSEFRRQRPFSRRRPVLTTVEETAILLWTQPLLAEQVGVNYFPRYGRQRFNTEMQLGLELSRLWLLEGSSQTIEQDFWRWTAIFQLTNRVAYQGYQLVTRTGLRVGGWHFAQGPNQRTNMFFMTLNAGLN